VAPAPATDLTPARARRTLAGVKVLLLALALGAAPNSAPTSAPPAAAAPAAAQAALELSPALVGPPGTAGALLEAGKAAEALAALGAATRPEARLVRGLALEASGDAAGALAALEGLDVKLPEVADRIQAARGRLHAAAGRHRAAAEAFAAVPAGSLLSAAAALGRGRALAAAGAAAEALEAVGALVASGAPEAAEVAPALLLAAGAMARATPSDAAGARRALLDCWAGQPLAVEAQACLAALKALPGEAGKVPGPEEVVWRAENLLERNRNEEAIKLLDPVVAAAPAASASEPFACRARAALGRALRRDRQNGRAADLLRPVADRCTDAALRTRAAYVLATAVSAQGAREEAVVLYRRFAREHPESPLADDALFAAAELAARAGRPAEARECLQALVRDHPAGDRRAEARFKLAWLARKAGDQEAAIAALLAIEEETRDVDAYEHGRAAYWRARLLAGRGEGGLAAARAIWRELAEAAPSDYYALLSRARLAGETGVALPGPTEAPAVARPPPAPGPLLADRHFRAGVALLRAGLPRAAAEELSAADRSALGGAAERAEPVLLLAELLDRAGDHRGAHQLLRIEARAALRRPPDGPGRRVWEVAYPPAHAELVRRHAPPAGVPAELLQALMREESALDPEAVSPAGAIGLTQLMLPTAQGVARQLKLPRPDRAALMQPATSIRIGAAYLGELLRTFDGSAPLALAAYNAGAAAVGRWKAAGPGLALDELVEEIPYDETRGYVKRVLRSYAAYRILSPVKSAARAATAAGHGG